jgi:hypothetical protein
MSEGRARVQVRTRNEAAGFGAAVNRVPPPRQAGELPRRPSSAEGRPGREVTRKVLIAAPVPALERAATVVVRRAKRKRSLRPPATKVTLSPPGVEPLEAVVMHTTLGGPDEVVLTLVGVSPKEDGAQLAETATRRRRPTDVVGVVAASAHPLESSS